MGEYDFTLGIDLACSAAHVATLMPGRLVWSNHRFRTAAVELDGLSTRFLRESGRRWEAYSRPVDRRATLCFPARRVGDHADLRYRLGLWSSPWAASGSAGLQESNGDESGRGSQSVSPHPSTALEESIMTATYTFDVFSSLDGYGAASGNWTGYWGKQGPELLDHRLALYGAEQRMVFGANTYRAFARMLASSTEESEVRDPWVTRMVNMPATVVSTTLEGSLDWPDATVVSGDAVDVVARLKGESEVPVRSHGSLSLNRALMAAGLVDYVQVTLFPVITGQSGLDPIFQGAADFDLELIESRTLDGHIQELIYRPTLH